MPISSKGRGGRIGFRIDKSELLRYTGFGMGVDEQDAALAYSDSMDDYPFALENLDPDEDRMTSVVIEPTLTRTDRSIARRASLQILYELDTSGHPLNRVLEAHIQARPESRAVRRIIAAIVTGVTAHRDAIDERIQQYAPDWPISQVAVVDRNVLRIAVFEYVVQKRKTPIPVIINEAVHLAQIFGAENSYSFVHGVLGAMTADETADERLNDSEANAR